MDAGATSACTSLATTVEEALQMMTVNAAYALFRGEEVGSLVPGKYAALIRSIGQPVDGGRGRDPADRRMADDGGRPG